ncbi:hypothetical protein [Prochlorococcus sp. MIT 1341]|uniref:hypothetical protein n=1 Tax=Prochlorococcus sp. MIT 1341 TaxID=3096221 RepID=UPI002A748CA6|nr:hypothetical protein [Prochlorococcus sp. MIT 1341]
MFTLITVSCSLFLIGLTGWTVTTYFVRKDSQKFIKEELKNLSDIFKMFFVSLKSLIKVLAKASFSSDSSEDTPAESTGMDEQALTLVEAPSVEMPFKEDEDTALSSFSPELVEVITEEEEKVA